MPSIAEVLSESQEHFPNWLQYTPTPFYRENFFSSRNLYYPSYVDDSQPIKLCAQAHAAHTFVYADYGVDRETIGDRLHHPQHRFLRYTIKHEEELTKSNIVPQGWEPHVGRSELPNDPYWFVDSNCLGILYRWSRKPRFCVSPRPVRIAGLFIGGDGFATFDELYCQEYEVAAPYLILIQDHGFGGNIPGQQFSRGGLLETLAHKCDKRPTWLLVGEPSTPWDGYVNTGADHELGGMQAFPRRLYRMDPNASAIYPFENQRTP